VYVLAVFMHMGGAAAKCVLWARSRELGTAHLGWRVDQGAQKLRSSLR
jgi:hypothetical protein